MMLIASEFEKLLLYVSARVPHVRDGLIVANVGGATKSSEAPQNSTEPGSSTLSAVERASAPAAAADKSASLPAPPTKNRVTLGDVETMVLAAKQRSLYELTDAISSKDRVRALEVLDAILSSGDGEEAAIGHIYMLAKTFRQMLVILERNVRDQRMLWAALWQGFRVPPFAADDIIK